MMPITSLWLPILLSAVVVFFVSFVIHMLLPYHRKDFRGVPNEDAAQEALRALNIPPGEYMVPHAGDPSRMKDPDFIQKYERGPVALFTIFPPGKMTMAPQLVQWFIYSVIVSINAAYIASRALDVGADYMEVFRFAGATAFFSYAVALWQQSIWFKRAWSTTLKNTFDGLVYALMTAGVFGWLWPQ